MKNALKEITNKFLSLINLKIIKLSSFQTISKLPRSFYVYAALPKTKQEKIFNLLIPNLIRRISLLNLGLQMGLHIVILTY